MRLVPYSLDVLNSSYCAGWCYHRLFRDTPVVLSFYRGSRCIGSIACNQYRGDLKDLGLHPTGNCGFALEFHPLADDEFNQSLVIKHNYWMFPLEVISPDRIRTISTLTNPVFFMHIPKTAGTSFNQYIKTCIHHEDYAIDIQKLNLEEQVHATQKSYVSGHIPLYRINEIYPNPKSVHLHTILREPFSHLHSHLAWVKGIAGEGARQIFQSHAERARNLSLRINQLNLGDTDTLLDFVAGLSGFELEYFDNLQTRYFLDKKVERVSFDDLVEAKSNLARFEYIGTTEKFDDFISSFCATYKLRHIEPERAHNRSNLTPLFDINDREVRNALRPLVQYDLELYRAVKLRKGLDFKS